VIHWDLGHRTPATDDEFLKRLKQELIEALKVGHPDYAEYLKSADGSPYEDISTVLASLVIVATLAWRPCALDVRRPMRSPEIGSMRCGRTAPRAVAISSVGE